MDNIVIVQVGQCGNQTGLSLFNELYRASKYLVSPLRRVVLNRFFRRALRHHTGVMKTKSDMSNNTPASLLRPWPCDATDTVCCLANDDVAQDKSHLVARAVLIDMEPKVLRACINSAGIDEYDTLIDQGQRSRQFKSTGKRSNRKASRAPWRYDQSRCVQRQSGSANNWAYGYSIHGPACREVALQAVNKELALCDSPDGILVLHSMGGGTGSGLGAYLTKMLKEEFSDLSVWNAVVWPHNSGEVVVQPYNCMFTLASLSQCSDAVLMFDNDVLYAICHQLWRIHSPMVQHMNLVLAQQLASILLPSKIPTGQQPSKNSDGLDALMMQIESYVNESFSEALSTCQTSSNTLQEDPSKLTKSHASIAAFDNSSFLSSTELHRIRHSTRSGIRPNSDLAGMANRPVKSSSISDRTKSIPKKSNARTAPINPSNVHTSLANLHKLRKKHLNCFTAMQRYLQRISTVSSIFDKLTHVACGNLRLPFLTLRVTPLSAPDAMLFNSDSWPALIKRLRRMQLAAAAIEETIEGVGGSRAATIVDSNHRNCAIQTHVVIRGPGADEPDVLETLSTIWGNDMIQSQVEGISTHEGAITPSYGMIDGTAQSSAPRICAVISNCQACLNQISNCLQRSWTLYCAHAYFFQYERFGIDKEHFIAAWQRLAMIADAYADISVT